MMLVHAVIEQDAKLTKPSGKQQALYSAESIVHTSL